MQDLEGKYFLRSEPGASPSEPESKEALELVFQTVHQGAAYLFHACGLLTALILREERLFPFLEWPLLDPS